MVRQDARAGYITCMVRQYVTTMMTNGIKKATKEPISMKRSSLRTQLPLTKTLSSLRRPITGMGIDTPRQTERIYKRHPCFLTLILNQVHLVLNLTELLLLLIISQWWNWVMKE